LLLKINYQLLPSGYKKNVKKKKKKKKKKREKKKKKERKKTGVGQFARLHFAIFESIWRIKKCGISPY